ncbi:MAG: hypothetical protein FWD96_02280 [Defluviitaleaceae bacterium]|nr:hypothetical protein [Defluviitaleaceae bacterium]
MNDSQYDIMATKTKIRDVLRQILEHSKNTNLAAVGESTDDFINMVESRQALFDELAALNPQKIGTHTDESKPAPAGILMLDEEIKAIIKQIVEREEQHNNKVVGMMEDLKKGLKDISTEKSINSIYMKDSYESGMIFNSKN